VTDNLSQNIKIIIFWDMTSCTSIYRYQHFRETCCFHVAGRSWTLQICTQSTRLHGVVLQKALVLTFTDVRLWNSIFHIKYAFVEKYQMTKAGIVPICRRFV